MCSAAPLHDKTISFAINRGHDKVPEADIEDALKRRSNYLVTYFGFELRDVSGIFGEGIL